VKPTDYFPVMDSADGEVSHRLVVTGAPGSGKTEFLQRLKNEPAFSQFVFFKEIARMLLIQNPDYRSNWAEFHREIYHRQIQQEEKVGLCPFVTDRGTIDAFAFHREAIEEHGIDLKMEYRRYTGVVQLGSPAALGATYHMPDEMHTETAHEALKNETHLRRLWQLHPNYHFITATTDPEKKYRHFLETMMMLIRTM